MIITLTDVPASPGLVLCLHSGYQQGQWSILKEKDSRRNQSLLVIILFPSVTTARSPYGDSTGSALLLEQVHEERDLSKGEETNADDVHRNLQHCTPPFFDVRI
jgi:hypothetical protein